MKILGFLLHLILITRFMEVTGVDIVEPDLVAILQKDLGDQELYAQFIILLIILKKLYK